jgi:hypothetical protein
MVTAIWSVLSQTEQRDRNRIPCGVAPRPKRRIATVADMLTS